MEKLISRLILPWHFLSIVDESSFNFLSRFFRERDARKRGAPSLFLVSIVAKNKILPSKFDHHRMDSTVHYKFIVVPINETS